MLRASLLVGTALMALTVASTAVADDSDEGFKKGHKIGGNITLSAEHHSNIGAAPSSVDTSSASDEDDDGDEEEDALLNDLIDDADQDDDDLAEIDGPADEDGDGIDDALDGDAGPTSRTDSAWRGVAKLGLKHQYGFDSALAWKSALALGGTQNRERDDLDRVNWAINTGPVFKLPHNVTVNPSVTFLSVYKDSERTTDTWLGSLDLNWQVAKALKLGARYNYLNQDVVAVTGSDSDISALKFTAKYKLGKKDTLSFGFSPNFTYAERDSQDKDRYGFDVGYTHKFPMKIEATLKAKYSYTDFDTIPRQDNDMVYTAGVKKTFGNKVFVGMAAQHKERESSISAKNNNTQAFVVETGWKF